MLNEVGIFENGISEIQDYHMGSRNGKPMLFAATKNSRKKNPNFQIVKKSGRFSQKSQKDLSHSNGKEDESEHSFCSENMGYLKLLLAAAESFMEKGLANAEELFTSHLTYEMSSTPFCLNPQSEISEYKCENESCNVITMDKSDIFSVSSRNKNSKYIHLCKTCHHAHESGQYCFYCGIIYSDNANSTYNDHRSWIQCDFCELWQHIQCEELNGTYNDISVLNTDPSFKYKCPVCRCNSQESTLTKSNRRKNLSNKNNKKADKKRDFIGNKQKNPNDEISSNGKQPSKI